MRILIAAHEMATMKSPTTTYVRVAKAAFISSGFHCALINLNPIYKNIPTEINQRSPKIESLTKSRILSKSAVPEAVDVSSFPIVFASIHLRISFFKFANEL